MDDTDTPSPAATYHLDRPSHRTPAERLEHFEHWWDKHGEPYHAAVIANGDTPWTADLDERRELFMRRYDRPAPRSDLTIPNTKRTA
ncbi:MAG: hypothetical protein WA622_27080 [Mycobacterium sp.]|uniref:hypothetical protein n=1 Tax=Mycobacterium sp. TaxID=1785 RepID=UPI003BB52BB6